jgi:hypothetical protein
MTRRLLSRLLAVALSCLAGTTAGAQDQARAFSAFIDCSDFYCEPDFYRTEIAFVDHVRERTAADVHILITRQQTGGGGNSFTLAFYGQRRFAGIADTLTLNTKQGATEDENRQAIARTVKLGLARYIARTPVGERTSLAVAAPTEGSARVAATRDPWDAWVFRIGANINASRERDFQSNYIYGSLNVSRVTELWKTNMRVSENYNDQTFTIEGDEVTSVRRDFNGAVQQVRSFGEHWSAGMKASAGSSTYLNQHLGITAAPAIEYDVFPYKEYTRRALLLQYSAGVKHFRYDDTTVYFKTVETRPFQALNIALSQKEKWGSVRFEVNGYHYLHDLGKSRLSFYSEADVRLIKGLSLNLFGDYSVLHDQIYLPKGQLSREEVLLRQSQLATTYRAFIYMGISYTFGSVLNNVVNPRFNNNSSEF